MPAYTTDGESVEAVRSDMLGLASGSFLDPSVIPMNHGATAGLNLAPGGWSNFG